MVLDKPSATSLFIILFGLAGFSKYSKPKRMPKNSGLYGSQTHDPWIPAERPRQQQAGHFHFATT